MDDIIASCVAQDIKELDDIFKVIQWCGSVRIGEILWKNFLSGSVGIVGFDGQGEPKFSPRKDVKNED
jgi:hypothetical protein